eukprot:TRINITY_DN457_c0_g1_i6.p3 TRINITY_DN457_c0_g1~~TRINITY_DN457_c0_g1_i6.p3  ORF type:complete len:120 (-),score=27.76 TRINITY_DN457_c0_g1_i6:2331-2690(-)
MVQTIIWTSFYVRAWLHGPQARAHMSTYHPKTPLVISMRPAFLLEPEGFVSHVVSGAITPVEGAIEGFCAQGLRLADGRTVRADAVMLCTGHKAPVFPFLPPAERTLMEGTPGGAQLYR